MKRLEKIFFAFGTANTILIEYEAKDEKKVYQTAEEIRTKMLELNRKWSVFIEESEINAIHKNAGIQPVAVIPETYHLISRAIEFAMVSGGAFDITSRSLSDLWGFGSDEPGVPDRKKLEQTKRLVDYRGVLLDSRKQTVALKHRGQRIDLGGIAKGYAVDLAVKMLKQSQIEEAIINFGGSVRTLGRVRTIGIQNPKATTGTAMGKVQLDNLSAVTSGIYERYFEESGKQYHHILDPITGRPANKGLCAVTLIGRSALEMDALATIVLVMGAEAVLPILNQYEAEAIFVTDKMELYLTPGLADNFQLNQVKEMNY